MQPDEQITSEDSNARERQPKLEFVYYEQRGTRLYLRFTRLGVIVILLLTVVPLVAILLLFISNQPDEKINVNVTVPSPSPYSPEKPILRPPPPAPSPPRVDNVIPALPSPLTSDSNSNEQILPKQTPQPTPTKPPS